jgi:hypothetical protein
MLHPVTYDQKQLTIKKSIQGKIGSGCGCLDVLMAT